MSCLKPFRWRRGGSRGATVRTWLESLFESHTNKNEKGQEDYMFLPSLPWMWLFHVRGSQWFTGVSKAVRAGSEMRGQYFS